MDPIKGVNVLYLPSASDFTEQGANGAEHLNLRNKYFKLNITSWQASW